MLTLIIYLYNSLLLFFLYTLVSFNKIKNTIVALFYSGDLSTPIHCRLLPQKSNDNECSKTIPMRSRIVVCVMQESASKNLIHKRMKPTKWIHILRVDICSTGTDIMLLSLLLYHFSNWLGNFAEELCIFYKCKMHISFTFMQSKSFVCTKSFN